MVMASLIEAVYLPELKRQERRAGWLQQWWKPFSYSLAHELVDERDGSVFAAVFKWDHRNLLGRCGGADSRPMGAPSAVILFRGTLLCAPTIRRDMEDELRLLTCKSLRGSGLKARFVREGLPLRPLTEQRLRAPDQRDASVGQLRLRPSSGTTAVPNSGSLGLHPLPHRLVCHVGRLVLDDQQRWCVLLVQEGILEAALLLWFYLDEDEDAHVGKAKRGGLCQWRVPAAGAD